MRTNFKNFGKLDEGEIDEGDYVIVQYNSVGGYRFNNIGQILRIRNHYNEADIEFDPPIGKMFGIDLKYIKHWCSDKEKLEMLINTNKYNL